jgi:glutaredoxin 3
MSWFSFTGSSGSVPDHVPAPDRTRELALYKYDACPFCQRVMRRIDQLGLEVEERDTMLTPKHRQDLREATGRTQVPCLFVDGEPLFESADINAWLEAYAKRGAA